MFRISGLFSLVVTLGLGAVLFWTSQSVQDVERSLSKKNNAIEREKETIRVLSTEWDYLNRPQRLERLAKDGIGMGEPDVEETSVVHDISSIPVPVVPVMPGIKPASLSNIEPAASEEEVDVKYDQEAFDSLLESVDGGSR